MIWDLRVFLVWNKVKPTYTLYTVIYTNCSLDNTYVNNTSYGATLNRRKVKEDIEQGTNYYNNLIRLNFNPKYFLQIIIIITVKCLFR